MNLAEKLQIEQIWERQTDEWELMFFIEFYSKIGLDHLQMEVKAL